MDLIRIKLERITDFWNNFVWNYKIIQNQIVWDEEVKTNYYGDILNFFTDTFDLLKREPLKSDFQDSIFYVTGLLQIIYVHQDLTDELLRIFKIAESSKVDKNPNREIRNELIGHPISKETYCNTKKLKSSVFWARHLTIENLHYIKYSKAENFRGEEKFYKIKDIIKSHQEYLDKYFEKILVKIRRILKKYSKQLQELDSITKKDVDFYKIIDLTFQRYEYISELNCLYNSKYLLECYERINEHIRYKFVVDSFKKDLIEYLNETQSYIQELISEVKLKMVMVDAVDIPKIEIKFVESSINSTTTDKERDYHYEIGKLHGKHPVFGISYFKELFKDDCDIINELDNMELNMYNVLEYYSSFEYLRHLIENKQKNKSAAANTL